MGAGESTTGAVERISRICHGDIGAEFTHTLNDIHSGTSMVQAMSNMSDRVQIGAMTRFVDAIVVATERAHPGRCCAIRRRTCAMPPSAS